MAEVNKIYKEAEYIIRLNEAEFRTIIAALANSYSTCSDVYKGNNYFGLHENLLRGKK